MVGRIKKVTNQDGDVVSYAYDNAGNLHIFTFDIAGFSRDTIFTYDLTTGIFDKTEYGDVTKDYTFESDDLMRLISISTRISSTTINTISYSYMEGNEVTYGDVSRRIKTITQTNSHHYITQTMEYNAQGYITKITDFSSDVVEYYYDAKDQLIRENNEIDGYTYTYDYDGYGNLILQSYHDFSAGNGTLGTATKTETYTYDATWKDRLHAMSYSDTLQPTLNYTLTYTYDTSGNAVGIDDTRGPSYDRSFVWEGRRLISQTMGSTSIAYTYNHNGIRDSKTVGSVTTTYYLDGSLVLYETDGTDHIYYAYDVDGTPISMRYNGVEYFYMFDALGNVSYLVDSSGYTVVEYRYDAFGNITHQTSSMVADANPYRYRGYRYDQESGLYYLQSRYYDPLMGRFINADGMLRASDTVLGHNMFAYTENNPVMKVDPSGYVNCFMSANQDINTRGCMGGGRSSGWSPIPGDSVFMVDISIVINRWKFGLSAVINLTDEYIEFYPHIGKTNSKYGASFAVGVLDNYENHGDFKEHFIYAEGTYGYVGVGHSYDFTKPYDEAVKSTYLIISTGSSVGYDYYIWFENDPLILHWGD